jgi:hypothetical protein
VLANYLSRLWQSNIWRLRKSRTIRFERVRQGIHPDVVAFSISHLTETHQLIFSVFLNQSKGSCPNWKKGGARNPCRGSLFKMILFSPVGR